ncbi:unnamed protein product [Parnassius apollo]|uniref:(apollo) hypothetical protein n=1 Tax=Parnassius apollo TaxID=110799 RepID=A0A8S3WLG3_PARAO|nr:unnamed protein product [Parnassius apollo]
MAYRRLKEDEIMQHLFDYEVSENGFDDDDDSVVHPNFIPDPELPFEDEEIEEVEGIDFDSIMEDLDHNIISYQYPATSTPSPQPEPSPCYTNTKHGDRKKGPPNSKKLYNNPFSSEVKNSSEKRTYKPSDGN